ncbi:hypothetical protein B0H13DRAFT_2476711 [Mycena leptocephala]|nr:hypothetical protein B0H13DRAFT_2476711 [Mycena leptocephala]
MSSKSVDTEKPERSRNAKAQARHRAKRKPYIEEAWLSSFVISRLTRVPQLEETAAVLLPPLAKLEVENARLMRENHDLHPMLSDTTTGPRHQLIPFYVVPRTRNGDDASPDREFKRRKIDIPNGEEYISRPGSSHDVLARPAPLTVPDSPLHPHPHHYDLFLVPTNPPFGLGPVLHLPDARPHYNDNGTSGPTLHLPDSPPYHDERDHASLPQPHAHAHVLESGRDHGHGYTLPPRFRFSHTPSQSPVDLNGNEHDSWRPYA